jgi:hypothetical protein
MATQTEQPVFIEKFQSKENKSLDENTAIERIQDENYFLIKRPGSRKR